MTRKGEINIQVWSKSQGKLMEVPDEQIGQVAPQALGDIQPRQQTQTSIPPAGQQLGGQTPPPQNQQGGFFTNLLGSIIKPFVQTAKTIGGAAVAIPQVALSGALQKSNPQLAANIASVKNPFLSDADLNQADKKPLQFLLEKGLKPSAGVASWAIPFGKAAEGASIGGQLLTKALLPGAATGGLQAFSEDNSNLESVLKGAALGAGGAGILHAGGEGIKLLGEALGKGAGKASESLAVKSLRPSPSQMYNFVQDTGEKLPDFLKSRGLEGADFDKITQHIEPLQKSFDEVASNPGIKIDPNEVVNGFSKEIDRLKGSILPADQQKSKVLSTIAENFIDKYGNKPVTADVLTSLRKDIDKGITDFALDPAVKSPLNTARDVLQGTIRDAADNAGITLGEGKSLKDAGRELSKLYKLQDIAEKTQYKGQGSMPVGITQLLGGGLGGGVAGLPGAAAGMAAANLMNSPQSIRLGSKVLGKTAGLLANQIPGGMSKVGQYLGGQTASRLGDILSKGNSVSGEPTSNNNNQENYNSIDNHDNSLQQQSGDVQRQITPEQMQQVYMAAATGQLSAKSAAAIKNAYDVQEENIKNQGETKLTTAQQSRHDALQTALSSLDSAETNLVTSGGARGPIGGGLATIPVLGGLIDPSGASYHASKIELATQLAKAITGGARASESVIEQYLHSLPDVNDPPRFAAAKLKKLRSELLQQSKSFKFNDINDLYSNTESQ